jgi:nitrogen fixation protein
MGIVNKIIQMKNSLALNIDIFVVKEDKYFVAFCPALDLSAYADTSKKALESFKTEVKIFLDETHKLGTLEKYLLKNGWRLQQSKYEPPKQSITKIERLHKLAAKQYNQKVNIPVCC